MWKAFFGSAFLSLYFAVVEGRPNLGPQYYSGTTLIENGSSLTTRLPVSSVPEYASTSSTSSTSTWYSTATYSSYSESTSSSTTSTIVPVPYTYAVTVYYTSTSFYTSYSTTKSTTTESETSYATFTYESTTYSASSTTSTPSCSGTVTETTTIILPLGPTFTLGTTYTSALVQESYFISGTSTSTDFYSTTTTYFVSGPPHPQVTTAPTDIHTAPFTFNYPCATITLTETLSYDPIVYTGVEVRQTVATTFSSSESWTTTTSTTATTSLSTATQTFVYKSSVVIVATALPENLGYTTMTPDIRITTTIDMGSSTSVTYVTYASASTGTTEQTFHITATIGYTSTYKVGGDGTQIAVPSYIPMSSNLVGTDTATTAVTNIFSPTFAPLLSTTMFTSVITQGTVSSSMVIVAPTTSSIESTATITSGTVTITSGGTATTFGTTVLVQPTSVSEGDRVAVYMSAVVGFTVVVMCFMLGIWGI